MNNSRILGTKNAKFSEHYFYLNTNMYGNFQICISVPLSNPLCTWPYLRRCLHTHERMNEHSRLCSKFNGKSKSESHFLLSLHHVILCFYYPLPSTHSHWFHCFDYCCRLDIITSCLSTQSVRYCKILNQKWCQSRN